MTALRLGTRGSALALAQARWVAERLPGEVAIVEITTAGDRQRAQPASPVPGRRTPAVDPGDKSRWTGALECALLAGEIDLAVHSAKDVPGELADGTEIAAVPPREDPRDVLVGAPSLDALPEGARVGTSALRRRAQLLAVRPDLAVVELRGNVDTRLRKLAAGECDALVLAAAGLARLGIDDVGGAALEGDVFVPAPGQGCLLVQARASDTEVAAALDAVRDRPAQLALDAERAVAARLGASCHTAVGVHVELAYGDATPAQKTAGTHGAPGQKTAGTHDGGAPGQKAAGTDDGGAPTQTAAGAHGAVARGFAGLPDGSEWLVDTVGGTAGAAALGEELAQRMLAAGAAELLARAEAMA